MFDDESSGATREEFSLRRGSKKSGIRAKTRYASRPALWSIDPDEIIHLNKQDTKDHICTLKGEPRDILTKFIDSGIFVAFRRKLKRFTMISPLHPYSRYYAPSIHRLKEEEHYHLTRYYYTIHPLSMCAFYFHMIICFLLIVSAYIYPSILVILKTGPPDHDLRYVLLGFSSTYYLLMMSSVILGNYDHNNNSVTLRKRTLFNQYAKTYLIFDILAIIQDLLRTEFAYYQLNIQWSYQDNRVTQIVGPFLTASRYVRYLWCLKKLQQIRIFYGMSTYAFRIFRLVLNSFLGTLLALYALFLIMIIQEYELQTFLIHMEHTIMMLFGVSHGHPVFDKFQPCVAPIIYIIGGFVIHLIMLTRGSEIWMKFSCTDTKQTAVYSATNAYMRYKALPLNLRQRISLYLDFKYEGKFHKETVIQKATSSALRREIIFTLAQESIRKVELFEKCPGFVLNKIKANLVPEIFLPGDIIIKSGTRGHCMFFILAGTVIVTSPENKTLCYLRDGAHFGEVALVVNVSRVANVIALTPCEVFKLDRQNFSDVLKNYRKIYDEIQLLATERISKTTRAEGGSRTANMYIKSLGEVPRTASLTDEETENLFL